MKITTRNPLYYDSFFKAARVQVGFPEPNDQNLALNWSSPRFTPSTINKIALGGCGVGLLCIVPSIFGRLAADYGTIYNLNRLGDY